MGDAEVFARLEDAGRHLLADFSQLTPVQREAIPLILEGRRVLLVAPTATGKTEAALAPVLSLRSVERWRGRPSIVYVAPTRALVNDLCRRLQGPLRGYLEVGRRTGEHLEADADLVITTPESLDSMLARGRLNGGHRLAGVRAILLDELHLLAESARGAQLNILLGRLDGVTGVPVLRVALSATVSRTEELARRFLGPDARVVQAGGGRSLRVQRVSGDGPLPERPSEGVDPLAEEIWRYPRATSAGPMAKHLLEVRAGGNSLKALVFVSSRSRCDRLAAQLTENIGGRAPVPVVGHHGSLSQEKRESSEKLLQTADESVAVATSTLEIGIDIGDIRSVVLDGPPGSVGSLLQRVGRANRRENQVHLMPFADSLREACILASMIRAAVSGELDPESPAKHFSVAIQQLASTFFQTSRSRLSAEHLRLLWEPEFGDRTGEVIEELAGEGWLKPHGPGLFGPSEALGDLMERPMQLHGNIGSSGRMIPVVDGLTGEPVAWVPRQAAPSRLVIAGQAFKAKRTDDAIELGGAAPSETAQTLRYAISKAPVLRNALRHLSLGLGLGDAALVRQDGQWIHFGGALYGELLNRAGCRSTSLSSTDDPRQFAGADFTKVVERHWESLESLCGFGPFHRQLPGGLRRASVLGSVDLPAFTHWLSHLDVCPLDQRQATALFC